MMRWWHDWGPAVSMAVLAVAGVVLVIWASNP